MRWSLSLVSLIYLLCVVTTPPTSAARGAIAATSSSVSPGNKELHIWGSVLPICLCTSANIGYEIAPQHLVGVNAYGGGLPMMGGGQQFGAFWRAFPFANSFFVNSRAGWMKTTWGHPDFVTNQGASLGADIGNQWLMPSGFTHSITWLGFDAFIAPHSGQGLPHALRYELGYRF